MALSQSIATPYGVEATYWTITKISIDRKNLTAQLYIEGYANQEAEINNLTPISAREYTVKFSENGNENSLEAIPEQTITPELIEVFETLSKFGYGLVKQAEEFNESSDI